MVIELSTWSCLEMGLEVNADRTEYMVMSGDRNAGRGHSVRIDSRTFEMMEGFECLGTAVTNLNYIQEEIKNSLKPWNACCHSVQNILSANLL